MVRKATTFSRVSTGYVTSTTTINSSDPDLGFIEATGQRLTLSGGLRFGAGSSFTVSVTTVSVDLPAIGGNASSSVTVPVAGTPAAIFVGVPSNFSGTYYSLVLRAKSVSSGVADLIASNTSTGTINADPSVFTLLSIYV